MNTRQTHSFVPTFNTLLPVTLIVLNTQGAVAGSGRIGWSTLFMGVAVAE